MKQKGWSFKEQQGSGFFFEKKDKNLIVTTQMWTGKFIIAEVNK